MLAENRLNLKFNKPRKVGLGIDDMLEAFRCLINSEQIEKHGRLAAALAGLIREFERDGKYELVMPIIRCYSHYLSP
jgi:hypothetical protein